MKECHSLSTTSKYEQDAEAQPSIAKGKKKGSLSKAGLQSNAKRSRIATEASGESTT